MFIHNAHAKTKSFYGLLFGFLLLFAFSSNSRAQSCTETQDAWTGSRVVMKVTCDPVKLTGRSYLTSNESSVLNAYKSIAQRCPEPSGFSTWVSDRPNYATESEFQQAFRNRAQAFWGRLTPSQWNNINICGSGGTYSGYSANTCTYTVTCPSCSGRSFSWGNCSAYASTTTSGRGLWIYNSNTGYTGSAYVSCSNGSWSGPSSTSCSAISCSSGTVTWGSGCSGTVYSTTYPNSVSVSNSNSLYSGSATATCNSSGAWSVSGSCSVVACPAATLSWGTSNYCKQSVSQTSINQSVSLNNTTAGATGSATATCQSNGTWAVSSPSCAANLSAPTVSATKGTKKGAITVTWGSVTGASSYSLQYKRQQDSTWTTVNNVSSGWTLNTSDYSIYEFNVTASNPVGSSAIGSDYGYIDGSCAQTTFSWGPSNFCTATLSQTPDGNTVTVNSSTGGTSGSITAQCSRGSFTFSNPTCVANLPAPTLSATQGTVNNAIQLTWSSVQNASGYRLEQRKQGDTSWNTLTTTTTTTSYTWSGLYDESVFEFRVIPTNTAGEGTPSNIATGYIRKLINPTFISQNVPAKVAVGQTFSISQTWRNDGSETWDNAEVYGTNPYAPSDTSVWGTGTVGFSGSTATGETVVTTMNLTAPTTPGTYNFQRIFEKSGTTYGNPSTATNIIVMGPASCTDAVPDKSVVYVPSDQVTVSIKGASQTESASIQVWAAPDKSDLMTYPAVSQGGNWVATFPVSDHNIYGTIYVNAVVGNSVTDPVMCKSFSINYPDLPIPDVTLTPTLGYFIDTNGDQGFVVEMSNRQRFAHARIGNVPLAVKLEVLDADGNSLVTPINNLAPGATTDVFTNLPAAQAWNLSQGMIRISYQDNEAAKQGKVKTIPVSWRIPPSDPGVNISYSSMPPFTVTVSMNSGYSSDANGIFVAAVEDQSGNRIADYQATDSNGLSSFTNINYASVYNKSLVGTAKVVPMNGVTLLSDIIYRSNKKLVPVMPPASIDASDGTFEDEVRITWSPPYDGVPLRYLVYRDGVMISNDPITATTFSDTTADRGKTYTYSVYAQVDARNSDAAPSDTGFIPLCRAPRLLGAWVSSDMTILSGLVEQWACLTKVDASGAIDGKDYGPVTLKGDTIQKYFTVPLDSLDNGNHTYRLTLVSEGVTINANRYYDIPFTVSRQDNQVADVTITHKGNTAQNGLTTDSFGWFGLKIQGGSGVGFAQPAQ